MQKCNEIYHAPNGLTFICKLPEGHSGEHEDIRPVVLFSWKDEVINNKDRGNYSNEQERGITQNEYYSHDT